MKNRFQVLIVCLGLALIWPVLLVYAQGTPPDSAVNAALGDLSVKAGRTLGLGDLDTWSWEQSIYPDASLGCPQPGLVYAQVQTPGFKFLLTYNSVEYDYRVANNGLTVILCNSAQVVPPCPPPDEVGYLLPRLRVGIPAQVADQTVVNIRSLPGTSGNFLGDAQPGAVMNVVGGPSCSLLDKLVWWEIDYNGLRGWVAEGQLDGLEQDYWLQPADGTVIPTPIITRIISANAPQVVALTTLESPVGVVVVAPNGDTAALGMDDGNVVLFELKTGIRQSAIQAHQGFIGSLAYDSTGAKIASGGADGLVNIFDLPTGAAAQLRLTLRGHTGQITALTFGLDDSVIASGGQDNTIRLWDAATGAQLALLTGHSTAVIALEFSADGSTLISRGTDNLVRFWGLPG